jgi:hypothetical protein
MRFAMSVIPSVFSAENYLKSLMDIHEVWGVYT